MVTEFAMKSNLTVNTSDAEYTTRLLLEGSVWWKRAIDAQFPYRLHIRKLRLGLTLDIGCGIGRNLTHLRGGGIGVDHNATSVEMARSRGLRAFTPKEFRTSTYNRTERFESILLAHVVEHMRRAEAEALLRSYLDLLKPGGLVVIIAPQEAGYRADPTHVEFMDFDALRRIAATIGLVFLREYSFPFPRFVGRFWRHNEFVSLSMKA